MAPKGLCGDVFVEGKRLRREGDFLGIPSFFSCCSSSSWPAVKPASAGWPATASSGRGPLSKQPRTPPVANEGRRPCFEVVEHSCRTHSSSAARGDCWLCRGLRKHVAFDACSAGDIPLLSLPQLLWLRAGYPSHPA